MIRRLTLAAAILPAIYGGYWWAGSSAMEAGFESWLDARRADGWTAEADVATRGFPSRFDTTFGGLRLADPRTGWGWEAPGFQTLMLSYDPTAAMAVWPPEQTVQTPLGPIEIESARLTGRVDLAAAPSLPLDEITLMGEALTATGFFGTLAAREASFATRRDPGLPNGHRIGLLLRETVLPEPLLAAVPPEARPEGLPTLRLDARAGLDRPLDRSAAEGDPPRLTELDVDAFELDWGEISARASGDLTLAGGIPDGRLDVEVRGYERLRPILTSAMGQRPGVLAYGVLSAMARGEGDPDVLAAPLAFENGMMSFGPIPLGPAPRLR